MADNKATERKKATIEFVDYPDFQWTNQSEIMTTRELCKYINSIFSRVFADFSGSDVQVDQSTPAWQGYEYCTQPIIVELYFQLGMLTANSDKKMVAFKQLNDKSDDTKTNRPMNYIAATMQHNYIVRHNKSSRITQDAIDILTPMLQPFFMRQLSMEPKAAELENRGILVETTHIDAYAGYAGNPKKTVMNVIKYVDINKIITKLFNDQNGKYVYSVVPIKPMIPVMNGAPVNTMNSKWLFNVSRIDVTNLVSKSNEMGLLQNTNGFSMYTETF